LQNHNLRVTYRREASHQGMGIFRRRRSGRRLDPAIGRRALRVRLRQLQRAHAEMESGQWAAAAADFALLAAQAEARRPVLAGQLWVECGRACLQNRQIAEAEAAIERGLSRLAETGRFIRLAKLGRRLVEELQAAGQPSAAASVQAKMDSWLEGHAMPAMPPSPAGPAMAGHLPAKCPPCGGTVMPGEIEALEDGRALCAYCGSILERS
jgi:hypothetical protein